MSDLIGFTDLEKLILKYPGSWDINVLARNHNISWDFIKYTITRGKIWNFKSLSNNPNITWEIIYNNPDIPWDNKNVSRNPNITWEIIRNNHQYPWNYAYLSTNLNITWEIIKNNPDKPWNYEWFLENPNITFKIIDELVNLGLIKISYTSIQKLAQNEFPNYKNTLEKEVVINKLKELRDAIKFNDNLFKIIINYIYKENRDK